MGGELKARALAYDSKNCGAVAAHCFFFSPVLILFVVMCGNFPKTNKHAYCSRTCAQMRVTAGYGDNKGEFLWAANKLQRFGQKSCPLPISLFLG